MSVSTAVLLRNIFMIKCNEPNSSKSFFKTISPYISDNSLRNGRMIILRENEILCPNLQKIFNLYYMSLSFDFNFINEGIMQKYIQKLVPNKAPGYDNIQSRLLKLSGVSISAPLSTIFNECVSNC